MLIFLSDFTLRHGNTLLIEGGNLSIHAGDQILLVGKSGTGKTSLGMALAGQLFSEGKVAIRYDEQNPLKKSVCFVPQFYYFKNKNGLSDFYYQQRFESLDDEDTPTLANVLTANGHLTPTQETLIDLLRLRERLPAHLIQLSSGERKKAQLVQELAEPCQFIILDNPYIGMDKASCERLNEFFRNLSSQGSTLVIIGDELYLPDFITHIVRINEDKKIDKIPVAAHRPMALKIKKSAISLPPMVQKFDSILKLKGVSVSYGNKTILKNVHWEVNMGEKWLLKGNNGAGKSTLLSLINGDNPQAYGQDLYIFDKKRGSGESIWDIKKNIGFISPELHWNFDRNLSCRETILSELSGFPNMKPPTAAQVETADNWMLFFDLERYKNQAFWSLPMGAQRLALLARAALKNPPLFIFDEPCQGLDAEQSALFLALVDEIFSDSRHTIIYVSHRFDQIPKCIDKTYALE